MDVFNVVTNNKAAIKSQFKQEEEVKPNQKEVNVKKFSLFLVMFLAVSLLFVFAEDEFVKGGLAPEIHQTSMERSPGSFDAAEYNNSMAAVVNWLRSEAVLPGVEITVNVSEEELAEMDSFECENCAKSQKLRVGLVKAVGTKISFPSLDSLTPTRDGGFVWTGMVESPGATALRLHFTNFNLPDNVVVYVYGINGEAFGPYAGLGYTGSGDFWSHTITGPVTYVQVRTFGPVPEQELKSVSFTIEGAGYLSEKFLIPFYQFKKSTIENLSSAASHCPDNAPCVEDASCYSGGAINDAKKAVAYMEWISGAWIYMCSGGLIADSDSSTQIPYFLTANHCISRDKDATNLECYFTYATSSCGGTCGDPGSFPRTIGAAILDSSRNGDHTLMQLQQNPPAGSVFMGWTNQPVANSDGTHLFRISHPSGMPQAYSEHVVDTQFGSCQGMPIGEFIYSQDVIGATEGGSSGSPVMNMGGQIVGQLYGACGYTLETCDSVENRTVDGAFAFYYDSVAPWLGSGGGDPPGCTATYSFVDSIVLSTKAKGPKTDAIAKVTIKDDCGNSVVGATVSGTFSGDVSGSQSVSTDSTGVATLKITITGSISSFSFCVDNVTGSVTYNPSANVETCDSI
jgi:V8-like Glu-specific endopeptidase